MHQGISSSDTPSERSEFNDISKEPVAPIVQNRSEDRRRLRRRRTAASSARPRIRNQKGRKKCVTAAQFTAPTTRAAGGAATCPFIPEISDHGPRAWKIRRSRLLLASFLGCKSLFGLKERTGQTGDHYESLRDSLSFRSALKTTLGGEVQFLPLFSQADPGVPSEKSFNDEGRTTGSALCGHICLLRANTILGVRRISFCVCVLV